MKINPHVSTKIVVASILGLFSCSMLPDAKINLIYRMPAGNHSAEIPRYSNDSVAINVLNPGSLANIEKSREEVVIGDYDGRTFLAANHPNEWVADALCNELEGAGYLVKPSSQPTTSGLEVRAQVVHFWIQTSTRWSNNTWYLECDLTLRFSLFKDGAFVASFESTENASREERDNWISVDFYNECLRRCLLQALPTLDDLCKSAK